MAKQKSAYANAGVDIDVMMDALCRCRKQIKRTATPGVLARLGSFGGLFKVPGTKTVLVSSMDGVGTKLEVARRAGKHDTVGEDLVNHCVNDILVQGARPWFFMDYLGTGRLETEMFSQVIKGFCRGCRRNGCALLGGETAEMPNLYSSGNYDLVGSIVGGVNREDLVTGRSIRSGDVLIGLHASGLHTNGYTLARKILFDQMGLETGQPFPGLKKTVGQVLLAVHRSYLKPVTRLIKSCPIRGMAHITGGGLVDNLPRILPDGYSAGVDRNAWKVPHLFNLLQAANQVDADEMYRVFNMGIGYVIMVRSKDQDQAVNLLRKAGERPRIIGVIEKGSGETHFID